MDNGLDISTLDRADLMYYYMHYNAKNENKFETSLAQHQYMQDKFVTPIAKAIQELDNHRYELSRYLGYGWAGLYEKNGYEKYRNDSGQIDVLTPSEKTTLINTMNETTASSNFNKENDDNCE